MAPGGKSQRRSVSSVFDADLCLCLREAQTKFVGAPVGVVGSAVFLRIPVQRWFSSVVSGLSRGVLRRRPSPGETEHPVQPMVTYCSHASYTHPQWSAQDKSFGAALLLAGEFKVEVGVVGVGGVGLAIGAHGDRHIVTDIARGIDGIELPGASRLRRPL